MCERRKKERKTDEIVPYGDKQLVPVGRALNKLAALPYLSVLAFRVMLINGRSFVTIVEDPPGPAGAQQLHFLCS